MNGPQHYREAERLAKCAENNMGEDADAEAFARGMALIAQAHATLALAAATAMGGTSAHWRDRDAWFAVLGIDPADEGEDC